MKLADIEPFAIVGTLSTLDSMQKVIDDAPYSAGSDVLELRIDETMDLDRLERLLPQMQQHTLLLTIRTADEGGTWVISDEDRLGLFQRFAPHVAMIDIEIASSLLAGTQRTDFPEHLIVVASYHDYEATPERSELVALAEKAWSWGADIAKLAVMTNTAADADLLEEVLKSSEQPICLIGMGPHGLRSRLEFPLLGSRLTYGFLDQSVAPGQVSCQELAKRLKK